MCKLSSLGNIVLTSSAHLVRMLFSLVLIKLISHYLGPEGLGRLGQFLSFAAILGLLAGGGISNGVVRYVSEYSGQPKKFQNFLNEAVSYTIFCSVIVLVLCCVFSKILASFLFEDPGLYWVFIVVGVAQCGYAATNLINSIVSGLRKTEKFAFIQIAGSLLAVPVIYILICVGGVAGAAIAIVSATFMSLIPAMYVYKNLELRLRFLISNVRELNFGRLPHYTLMLLTSAVAFPVVEIIVRQWLIQHSGFHDAGLWQGATKLSAAYLGFFSVFLAYVFLPLVSNQNKKNLIFKLIVKYMSLISGLFICGALVLYMWRYFFVSLLLSDSFSALGDVLIYQLIGDFFKICAYVIGFVGVAKGATALYIAAECLQSVIFVACVYGLGSSSEGLKSVMISYAITYACYFVVCCIALSVYLMKHNDSRSKVVPK